MDIRTRIIKRAALEFKDDMYGILDNMDCAVHLQSCQPDNLLDFMTTQSPDFTGEPPKGWDAC